MKTFENLENLSLYELRELRTKIDAIYTLKLKMASIINADNLTVGVEVKYVGGTNKIKGETFIVQKIKQVNALCKSTVNGALWNIKLANLQTV